jgi:hypothetical protein
MYIPPPPPDLGFAESHEPERNIVSDVLGGIWDIGKQVVDTTVQAGGELVRDLSSEGLGALPGHLTSLGVGGVAGVLSLPDMLANVGAAGIDALTGGAVHLPGLTLAEDFKNYASGLDPSMAERPGMTGFGEIIGNVLLPGIGAARTAGLGMKAAVGGLSGLGFGAAGDITQRYQTGQEQNLGESLYAGLPMGVLGAGAAMLVPPHGKAKTDSPVEVPPPPPEAPPTTGGLPEITDPALVQKISDPNYVPAVTEIMPRTPDPAPAAPEPPPTIEAITASLQETHPQVAEILARQIPEQAPEAPVAPVVDAVPATVPEPPPMAPVVDAAPAPVVEAAPRIPDPPPVVPEQAPTPAPELSTPVEKPVDTQPEVSAIRESRTFERPKTYDEAWQQFDAETRTGITRDATGTKMQYLENGEPVKFEYQGREHDGISVYTSKDRKNFDSGKNKAFMDAIESVRNKSVISDNPPPEKPARSPFPTMEEMRNAQYEPFHGLTEEEYQSDVPRGMRNKGYKRGFDSAKEQGLTIAKEDIPAFKKRIAYEETENYRSDLKGEPRRFYKATEMPASDQDPTINKFWKTAQPIERANWIDKIKNIRDTIKDPHLASRIAGVQTVGDAIKHDLPHVYIQRMGYYRDVMRNFTDMGKMALELIPRAKKATIDDILAGVDDFGKISEMERQKLVRFKELTNQYMNDVIKPEIESAERAGVQPSWFGRGRALRMLQEELADANPMPQSDGKFGAFLKDARGGFFKSIFLGNQEVAWLHAIETVAAGTSHNPKAMAQAVAALVNDKEYRAYAKKFSMRGGTEASVLESDHMTALSKLNKRISDITEHGFEKVLGKDLGGTTVEAIRAQLPEVAKIHILRTAMLFDHAERLNYPGGAKQLMRDHLSVIASKAIPEERMTLLDRAEIGMIEDMQRLVMFAPPGLMEKTVFQRHGEFAKMLFPFTRSVIQQSRLMHSFGADFIKAFQDKDYGKMAKTTGDALKFFGVLSIFAGSAAIPKEVDRALLQYAPEEREKLHEVLNSLYSLNPINQKVEHVQPKILASSMVNLADNNVITSQINELKGIISRSKDPEVRERKMQRAISTALAMFQLDSIAGGLVGNSKALQLIDKIGQGMKGVTRTKAAYSAFGTKIGEGRKFHTDVLSEFFDWAAPGVPDEIAEFMEREHDRNDREFFRETKNPLAPILPN